MNVWLPALFGVIGVAVGAGLGGLSTWWVNRRTNSRTERRDAYVQWLKGVARFPYTVMELARTADLDVTPTEQVQATIAEQMAILQLDGSKGVRDLIAQKWDGAIAAYQAEWIRLEPELKMLGVLKMSEKAFSVGIRPVMGEVARQMARDLHGRQGK